MTTTYTATDVTTIDISDIDRTYRGETGCACGCGGEYVDANVNDADGEAEVNRRIKYVLLGVKKDNAEFFGNGVEVANPSYTRCTRLYFKDGISYQQFASGRIERRVEITEPVAPITVTDSMLVDMAAC